LQPLLLGSSRFDTELLREEMGRSIIDYGRKGMVIECISGFWISRFGTICDGWASQ
jgi:hypothetical protein